MATLPTVPSFVFQDSSLTKLQQLAGAVGFCCQIPIVFHLYKTATQTVAASTNTAISWDAAMADSDGGWSASHPTRYTAQTPGYFHTEASVAGVATGANHSWQQWMQVTTGSGNPGGPGLTTTFAPDYDQQGTDTSNVSAGTGSITPYLYVGDYVEVYVYWPATTVAYNWPTSGNNDLNGYPDGGPTWTGAWFSEGP